MLVKLGELLARLGIVRLLIAGKALSSIITGYIASKIRAHSRSVHTPALFGVDKYAQVGDYKLHYVEVGEGIPLILLPGAFSTYRAWNRVIPLLPTGFRIIALDHLGAGSSDKPRDPSVYEVAIQAELVAQFVRELGLGPVAVAGVSYGAAVALILASRHPELVSKVVCVEGGMVHPTELPKWCEGVFKYPLIGDLVIGVLKTNFLNRLLLKPLLGAWAEALTPEEKIAVLDELYYNTASATRHAWYALSRAAATPNVIDIQIPVVYIYGQETAFRELATQNIEHLRLLPEPPTVIEVEGGTHYIHLQKPQQLAEVIAEFCTFN